MKKIFIAGVVAVIIIVAFLSLRPAEKEQTETVVGPPPAPTGVFASPGILLIKLSWDAVPSVTSYNIYWSRKSPVAISDKNKISCTDTRYVHAGLPGDTVYYYVVTAVNNAGESPAGREVSAVTWLPAPETPLPATDPETSASGLSEEEFQKQLMNKLMNSERPQGEPPDTGVQTWFPEDEQPPPREEWPDVGEPTWDPNQETPPPKSEWPGEGEKPNWHPQAEPQRSQTPF